MFYLEELVFQKIQKLNYKNGRIKNIKDVSLGDILENGSECVWNIKLKGGKDSPYYKIWSENYKNIYMLQENIV